MRLLLLGGTRFLGYHLTQVATARQHHVTLFHRAPHPGDAGLPVEVIYGDRHHDLSKLRERRWDAVIDTSGYLPRAVRASAEMLAEAVKQYVFISSVSVYRNERAAGVDEFSPVIELTREQLDEANAIDTTGTVSASTYGGLYGGLKVSCERAVEDVLPDRALIVRAGLIVGPRDYTDRFTYWVARVARGGEVLAPGRPERHVQLIDVRDLAEWILAMIERGRTGVFNATGPPGALTMSALLETCRDATGSDAHFTWVTEQFLCDERVAAWTEMPLWLPAKRDSSAVLCAKALAEGLDYRSLYETARDVWSEGIGGTLRAGLAADRERQLLGKWRLGRTTTDES